MKKRCSWCEGSDIYRQYHDEEWGVPVHDDRKFFEFLVLESAQAGLSWITILKRREGYRKAFADFDPDKVALFDRNKVELLMNDASIIRNRRKIESAIVNARTFLKVQSEYGSFNNYIWNFVDGKTIVDHFHSLIDVPDKTDLSVEIAKDMKKRGFTFLGPVIVYSLMQATGLVNDHLTDCFRFNVLDGMECDK